MYKLCVFLLFLTSTIGTDLHNWHGYWSITQHIGSQSSCCLPDQDILITQQLSLINITLKFPQTPQCDHMPRILTLENEVIDSGIFMDMDNYNAFGMYFSNNNSISFTLGNNCAWILSNPDVTIPDTKQKETWIPKSSYSISDTSTCCQPQGPVRVLQAVNSSLESSLISMRLPNNTICNKILESSDFDASRTTMQDGFIDYITSGQEQGIYMPDNDTLSLMFGNCHFILVKGASTLYAVTFSLFALIITIW